MPVPRTLLGDSSLNAKDASVFSYEFFTWELDGCAVPIVALTVGSRANTNCWAVGTTHLSVAEASGRQGEHFMQALCGLLRQADGLEACGRIEIVLVKVIDDSNRAVLFCLAQLQGRVLAERNPKGAAHR